MDWSNTGLKHTHYCPCGARVRCSNPACTEPDTCWDCRAKAVWATENNLDSEELEPIDGDSYDDANWINAQEDNDNE